MCAGYTWKEWDWVQRKIHHGGQKAMVLHSSKTQEKVYRWSYFCRMACKLWHKKVQVMNIFFHSDRKLCVREVRLYSAWFQRAVSAVVLYFIPEFDANACSPWMHSNEWWTWIRVIWGVIFAANRNKCCTNLLLFMAQRISDQKRALSCSQGMCCCARHVSPENP